MVEEPNSVTFANGGFFLPGTVRNAIEQNGPQKFYRNYVLCQGMVNFNMIDTIGRGIRKVFTEQQKRFFPMPDYQIDQATPCGRSIPKIIFIGVCGKNCK